MSAVSFEELIIDGVIRVPHALRPLSHGKVHVILWTEDEAGPSSGPDLIDELIADPLPYQSVLTRDEIYDDQ